MKVASLITLVVASQGAQALNIGGWFKDAFGFRPNAVVKAKGSDLEGAKKFIESWDAKSKLKNKDFNIRYYKVHKKNSDEFNPIFLRNGKHEALAGVYIQIKCASKDLIGQDKIKSNLVKSLDDAKIYTVRCNGNATTESM